MTYELLSSKISVMVLRKLLPCLRVRMRLPWMMYALFSEWLYRLYVFGSVGAADFCVFSRSLTIGTRRAAMMDAMVMAMIITKSISVCVFGGVEGAGAVVFAAGVFVHGAGGAAWLYGVGVVAVEELAGGADGGVFPVGRFSIWGMGDRRGRIGRGCHRCLGVRGLCRW